MEVSPEVRAWLTSLRLISPDSASAPCLSPSVSASLLQGSFFRGLFKRTLSAGLFTSSFDFSAIHDSPTPAGKLANWTFIFQLCAEIGIKVGEQQHLLVLAGDHSSIAALLSAVKTAVEDARAGRSRKPKVAQDGALFIDSLNPHRDLEEAESCLEFLLLSFCQHFRINAKQAAGLLTQGNKYLAQIITRGLKTDFQPVQSWYQRLASCASVLTSLILRESQVGSLFLVLSALRSGFLSRDEGVVLACCALFSALVPQLTLNSEQCWEWFTRQPGGVDACYAALQRFGTAVILPVVEVLHEAARFRYRDLLVLHLRAQSASAMEYLQVLSDLLPALLTLPQASDRLVEEAILPELLDSAVREADSDKVRNASERCAALTFLSVVWKMIPSFFESREDHVNSILAVLKKACRDKSWLLSCLAAGHLFALLVKLYQERSQYAPLIFKSLTFLLIETFENADVKEFVMRNFVILLREIQSLPVSTLVEPMVKQLNLLQDTSINCVDFDLFIAIAQHPRLPLEHAILLGDICGKQYLAQLHLARAAGIPLLLLSKRFLNTEVMREFIYRFAKLSLSVLSQSEKERKPLPKKKPLYNNKPVVIGAPISQDELFDEMARTHQTRLILHFLVRVIKLGSPEINARIRDLLVATITDLRRTKFDTHKGLVKVLGLLGNTEELLETKTTGIEAVAVKSRWRQRLDFLAEPGSRAKKHQASAVSLLRGSQPYSTADLDSKPAKHSPSPKRTSHKRFSSVGESPSFDYSEVVKVRDLDYSEEDLEHIKLVLKSRSRVTKYLFRNYCGSSYARSSTDIDTFEKKEAKKTHIREAELYKLLRDNGVSSSYLLKEQFSSLLKSYCVKNQTTEPTAVDYTQFTEMIVQIALFIYSRPSRDLTHLPPAASVLSLFELIRRHWQSANKPLILFDPAYLRHGDRDTVLQLNRQLSLHPNMDLPDGFRRIASNEIDLSYELQEETGVKESYRVAMVLLDEMVFATSGVHFLEARIVYRTVVRVEATGTVSTTCQNEKETKAAPTALYRNPSMKFELAKLQKKYAKEDLQEVAQLIDDLITSIESSHLVRGSSGRIQNRALYLREMREKEQARARQLAEQRRRQRQEELAELLQKASQAKRKQERKKKHRERKAERVRRALEEQLRERRRREQEARAAEMLEWISRKQVEEQEKRKAEIDKQQALELAKKLKRQKYEKVIKARLAQMIKQKAEARRQEASRAAESEKLVETKRQSDKRRSLSLLELERKRRDAEQQMKRDFSALSSSPEIAAVLGEYSRSLEALFDHYVKVGAKDPRAAIVLQLQGLNKCCLQFFLLPEIISAEEVHILYRMYTKEKTLSEPGMIIGMDQSEFFDCLIRIAALGQGRLRNSESGQFALADCSALTVKSLLTYMQLPTDPKRVIDHLKMLDTQGEVHPRERKRVAKERLAKLEAAHLAEKSEKK